MTNKELTDKKIGEILTQYGIKHALFQSSFKSLVKDLSDVTPSQEDIKIGLLDWVTGDDTGSSSKALMRYMLGISPSKGWGYSAPWDSSDRGRCVRLLNIMPEWLERLDEMAQLRGWEEQIPLIKEEYLTQQSKEVE